MGLRRQHKHLMLESSRADWIAMAMAWGGNQRNHSCGRESAGNLTCRNTTEIATARDRAVEHWTRGKRGSWAQQDLLPRASSKGFTIIPDATGLEGSYGDPASPRTAKTLNIRAPTAQGSNPTIGKTEVCLL